MKKVDWVQVMDMQYYWLIRIHYIKNSFERDKSDVRIGIINI